MIRRPSRTALHSALSALAGGLRGTAMQREQTQAREQQAIANRRAALRDAIDFAEMGATLATPEQMAAATPPPTVEYEGQRYVIPSLDERARRRAEAEANARRKAQLEDERKARQEQERANRQAYGAARMVAPDIVTGAYDPNVDYGKVITGRRQERVNEVTAAEVRQQELEAQRAAKRAEARAWLSTVAAQQMSRDEQNRLGLAIGDLISGSGMHPDDALVAVMEAENRRAEAAYQDAQRRRALADVMEPDTTTTQTGTGAMAPTPPGTPAPPVNMPPVNVPTSPAATPARPAQPAPVTPAPAPALPAPAARRKPYTDDEILMALRALGANATDREVADWLLANIP